MPIFKRFASVLSAISIGAIGVGLVQSAIGTLLLKQFFKQSRSSSPAHKDWPGVSILKPLYGIEPLLEESLKSFFTLDYPKYELIFGVQHPEDPAIDVVKKLKAQFPHITMHLVVSKPDDSLNRKVSNLTHIYAQAQYDYLVISDSDIHVTPLYLQKIISEFDYKNTGLVTTLYAGYPATHALISQLGANALNQIFMPGVLLSRFFGREDCLGATMALTRETLEAAGGFNALRNQIADDAILGQNVRAVGLHIRIAKTMTWTTVGETSLRALLLHELRWARTVKSLEPVGYAASILQLPLFWAVLYVLLAPRGVKKWVVLAVAYFSRRATAQNITKTLETPTRSSGIILPLRDILSAFLIISSFCGKKVTWRGQVINMTAPKSFLKRIKSRK